tara:strand:- start:275 stop:376 length:102 start_codon:yes stop_codon:yes gene_type:complete
MRTLKQISKLKKCLRGAKWVVGIYKTQNEIINY